MKKTLLLFLAIALTTTLSAGGIMTNTNQSAAFARMMSRNASLGIDAVYYNPAGLTKLSDGFHFSLNNQSIFQQKYVDNNYQYLHRSAATNEARYIGDVKAPLFPGVYAAYKMNKLVFSFGFNPVGGGGGAKYDKGLPSFEMPVSELVPTLHSLANVTDYKASIDFTGTSVFFGYQAGVSYEINDAVSVFAGVRYVTAKNTYKGSIKDIMVNPSFTAQPAIPGLDPLSFNGTFIRADAFGNAMNSYLGSAATYYNVVAAQMGAAATGLDPLVAGGAGGLTPAQAQAMGIITATQQAQIEGGLAAIGQPSTLTIQQAQGAFSATATQATAGATKLSAGAEQMAGLAAQTGDAEVDVVQKGTGYTPILGANFKLGDNIDLSVKYEFMTKLELTNKTKVDGTGKFPDGAKTRSDMPAMLAIGASFPVCSKVNGSLSFNYYFDRPANYGIVNSLGESVRNFDVIDHNFYEVALGFEYSLTDKLLLSAGVLRSVTGVGNDYQSDLSFSLSSTAVGLGGQYKISDAFAVNLGFLNTYYDKGERNFYHTFGTENFYTTEKLSKTTWLLAAGLDFKFGK